MGEAHRSFVFWHRPNSPQCFIQYSHNHTVNFFLLVAWDVFHHWLNIGKICARKADGAQPRNSSAGRLNSLHVPGPENNYFAQHRPNDTVNRNSYLRCIFTVRSKALGKFAPVKKCYCPSCGHEAILIAGWKHSLANIPSVRLPREKGPPRVVLHARGY